MPGPEPISERAERWDARMLAAIQGGAKEHPERPNRPWAAVFHLPLIVSTITVGEWTSVWLIPAICLWAAALTARRVRTRRRRARSARSNAFGR